MEILRIVIRLYRHYACADSYVKTTFRSTYQFTLCLCRNSYLKWKFHATQTQRYD